ncbi:MAG: hypothetical protein JXA11_10915 [Phycisphaerae bacterium]|nr:hypothetical protein [Phycisphaerae bacterium]
MRKTTYLFWMCLILTAGCFLGCGEKPVYDEMAVRNTKSVVVVPFQSPAKDPSGGAIAAGMISSELLKEDLKDLQVRVAPVVWRISHPSEYGLSDTEAIQLAKTLGVDAVVTGTVNLTLETEKTDYKPKALKAGQVAGSSTLSGDVVVTLRMVSAESGACIYSMNGKAKGTSPTGRMESATDKAVEPLIGLWKKAQRGW